MLANDISTNIHVNRMGRCGKVNTKKYAEMGTITAEGVWTGSIYDTLIWCLDITVANTQHFAALHIDFQNKEQSHTSSTYSLLITFLSSKHFLIQIFFHPQVIQH